MNEDRATLEEFNGIARLFPLPGMVLFPNAVQPLHIFEPRYRQMTADALAGDRLIALVLLHTGWDESYDDRPAIHSVASLGKIVADYRMPDGRFNLILRGLARVRVIAEPPTDKLYRLGRVEILTDVVGDDVPALMALRTGLAELILPRVTEGPVREQLRGLFKGELPLGQLCDVLAFALPLPPEVKQELLEEQDVSERARRLMTAFQLVAESPIKPPGAGRRFPPDFSAN
jgi:Lon protease-like protein